MPVAGAPSGLREEQDIDAGATPSTSNTKGGSGGTGSAGTDSGGQASAGDGGASGQSDAGTGGQATAGVAGAVGTGVVVKVEYSGSVVPVDLGVLSTADYKGLSLAKMSDVWVASGFSADLAKVQLDFEGDDGFHPSSKPSCQTAITGTMLEQGYIDPVLRNLLWDDALGLPGCFKVKGLARLIASDLP